MVSSPPSTHVGLAVLNQALARYIRATNLYPGLRIETVEHGGRLLLVGQHGAPELKTPNALLKTLERAFGVVIPTVGLGETPWAAADVIPVRIYLKLRSVQQPYAMHTFTWRVIAPSLGAVETAGDTDAANALDGGMSSSLTAPETAGDDPIDPLAHDLTDADVLADGTTALALGDISPAPPPSPASPAWPSRLSLWLRYYWSYGVAALILLASGLFVYALSRPCAVGGCDRLDRAETLYEEAQTTLAVAPTRDDLVQAEADLQTAMNVISPIPTWSGHYPAAQADRQRYHSDLQAVRAILQAQATATEAAELSQNPPHSVERWVNVHLLWQQAIEQLDSVPSDSPAFDYAQKKCREYQANHSAIGQRIAAEEGAEANFNKALEIGQLAQQRMDTANSLAGWQLAAKEWQAAIQKLSLIPQGTMVYNEAQTQLKDYQQHLRRTTNQKNLEDAGTHNYDQAIRAARAAAAYEAKNQWTLAVTHWQRAVASAQQIPTGTILAEEGALLLETYQPALLNAQSRLRTNVAIQGLTTTLAQLCAQKAAACTVREDPSQVQIMLASQYADPLRLAITPPAADGTFTFTTSLDPEAQQLIQQIMTFSHQVDRQVAIYDHRGGFVARYRPDLGGFIKN